MEAAAATMHKHLHGSFVLSSCHTMTMGPSFTPINASRNWIWWSKDEVGFHGSMLNVVLHCCQEMNAITIVSQVGAPMGTGYGNIAIMYMAMQKYEMTVRLSLIWMEFINSCLC